ncbi:MAG: peptide deformylase [Candidatus Symbiothrix sp.]|nr:peptide deformylase [Candidatus Symbiothrix sp.]
MKRVLFLTLFLTGLTLMSGCSQANFSEEEQTLINNGTAEDAFRVLLITDKQDSLVLRTPGTDIVDFEDPALQLFIERLKTTLVVADGVGIAAPQVGVSKNIFLFSRLDLPGEPVIVAINPKIINHPDTTVCFERDGCLSIPGVWGNSIRYPWVEVEYYNEKGGLIRERLEGYSRQDTFSAVIFQHEYDHTEGVLYIDKLFRIE